MQEQRSACDSCRRRKLRCDSAQPCRRCVDTGVECTYGRTLHRVSSTSYIRTLEQQITELRQQLRAATNAPAGADTPSRAQQHPIDLLVHAGDDLILQQPAGTRIYRFTAALNILRTVADMLDPGITMAPTSASPGIAIVEAIDSPLKIPLRDNVEWLDVALPPQTELHRLISCATDRALIGHRCIDPEAFHTRVDELFSEGKFHTISKDRSFMSFVYAVLALGERYSAEENDDVGLEAGPSAVPPGFLYFRASRCITHADLENCSLDTVLARTLQARYLWSVSHVSEAHSTLCKGISVATHLGLHFNDSALRAHYTTDELDERRRVFAVVYEMDTYISFVLGLPRTLSYADPKQTLSLPHEELHDEGQGLLARNPTSPLAETVMAQKMFYIYAKILDHQSDVDVDTLMGSEWIAEVQQDFQTWERMLPELPNDPSTADSRALLGQLTLRMHYIGAQITLYAPFIHHLARERSDENFNIDSFTYGSACVRAAAQTVLLVEILDAQNLLNPAQWMNGFILTMAASVLTYFVLHSKNRVTIEESKSAILKAGRLLAELGESNVSNKRVLDSLRPYVNVVLGQEA